jgi:hypothetical protein
MTEQGRFDDGFWRAFVKSISQFRFGFWLGALLFAAVASAQNTQVAGQITDESKAVISDAQITLSRSDTGEQKHTISTGQGYYSFPSILPGTYSLTIDKQGFGTVNRTDILVQTGQTSTVDVALAIGTVNQSVTVSEAVPQLQTQTAAVGNEVDNKTIVDMPLLDRRSSQLQRLSGFVVPNGTGSGATFAIAGGRGNNANYLIDGGEAQNLLLGVPTLMFDPPVESVQEFNVAVSNYAAELGRTGGAVIQMTTKSGTNDLHGSLYEFFRNDVLNTRSFFASSVPKLRYNLFGGSISGPIIKNKTQFFFNYEGRRQTAGTTNVFNVPSSAERAGNFTGDATVSNPVTRAPYAGNIIPQNQLDPIGSTLASYFPVPNVPGARSGTGNFRANQNATGVFDDYVARIDHTISDRDRIYGRLLAQTDHTVTAAVFPVAALDPNAVTSHNYYYDVLADYIHTFTPTLLNEFRFGYQGRQALSISSSADSNLNGTLGLTGVDQTFGPTVAVSGYAALGNTNQQQRLQSPIVSTQYVDQMTWVHGSHQVKWGFETRHSANRDLYSPTAGGSFVYNNLVTGNSLASLLLGWTYSGTVLSTEPLNTRAATYGAFIQDDWHVTSKLTLNLGLRYDLDEPRWETNNRQNGFDANAINPVSGTLGVVTFSGRDGQSKFAHQWDKNNFGPRIGFAWNPAEHWVIRGGGAVLFLPEYDQATPIVTNLGFSTQGSYTSTNNGITPAFILSNGFPGASTPTESQLTPAYGAVTVGSRPTTTVTFFDPNRVNGYLYQASFDIQRELKGGFLVDAGYLGTFGHHLPAPDAESINQVPTDELGAGNAQARRPYPQYNDVQMVAASIGASKYNGLNIGVQKRYSYGLHFQANYTWAKSMDNVSSRNELAAFPTSAFANYYDQRNNWGLSGNDIRHRFVFSSVYEIPVGTGRAYKPGSRLLNAVVGNWSIGVVNDLRSGTPLEAVELTNNTGSFSQAVRPNVVGDPNDVAGGKSITQWFNTAAFQAPAQYTFGNAGRTFGEGPGAISLDTSLLKDFTVKERFVTQFRVEGLNILNHANFSNPDTRQGSPTYGRINSLVSGNQDRIIQFGLHLQF